MEVLDNDDICGNNSLLGDIGGDELL